MADRDALGKLPEFKWRGKAYPISNSRHSFRHELAEHRVSYGGLTLVDPLGPQNPTFSYTLPMDQGIARGPYTDLLKKIPTLARDMYDRTPGELTDPLFGTWTVVPSEFSSDLDAKMRSGVPVQLAFLWAPDLDKDVKRHGGVDSVAGLVSDANALDAVVEVIARKYDKNAKPPRINPLDAVSSVTGQLSRGIEKTQAKLKRITYQCEKTEAYTRRLLKQTRDPDAFGAVRESRRIRASAIRLQRDLNATSRDLVQVTIGQAKAVLTVAAEASMTAKELLALNVELAASPLVAAGTIVTIIKPKAA
jgi:hypothetical protein